MIVALVILLGKFGSLQRSLSEVDSHVKTVTDPALGSLRTTIDQMNLDVKTVSAPVHTLGQVATGLQQSIDTVRSEIKDISVQAEKITTLGPQIDAKIEQVAQVQAEKIATLGQRYAETEKHTKDIHSILIGSYSKGKAGEEALRAVMTQFVEMGYVKANEVVGRGIVEYAIVFNDGKTLAIDSKVVSTADVASYFDENLATEERSQLGDKIRRKVRDKIAEVQKYIDPGHTLPLAVMAVPDSIMEIVTDLIPEAVKRDVILVGYSAVPQLISYFVRIHGFYAIREDIAELQDRISKVRLSTSRLDVAFFSRYFERPLGSLEKGVNMVKIVLLGIANTVANDTTASRTRLEPGAEEEKIQVAASK